MRTLAIDLGSKRVGLALSDEGGQFATPANVIDGATPNQLIAAILEIVHSEAVRRVLVGLPLNMDGSIGPAAKEAIVWGKAFSIQANVPVIFVDERLSSFDAEQRLIDRKRGGEKITRKQKKSRLDALAAAGFLQAFLDGKLPPIEVGPA